MAKIRGSCLCGGVRFEIEGKTSGIGECLCSRCRKVSGASGNAAFYVAARNFTWLRGTEQIKAYEVPQTNGWKSVFCSECGCPAPLLDRDGKLYIVPAGSLDDDPGHRGMAAHIYADSKAPWVVITDDAPQYAEGFP
ncbi:MAG: GFA family protein [Alphaproteobacteria bacterium]